MKSTALALGALSAVAAVTATAATTSSKMKIDGDAPEFAPNTDVKVLQVNVSQEFAIGLDEQGASTGMVWGLDANDCMQHLEIHPDTTANFAKTQQTAEGGCVLGTMTCGSTKTEVCVAANCATGNVVTPTKTIDPVAPVLEPVAPVIDGGLAPVIAPVTATDVDGSTITVNVEPTTGPVIVTPTLVVDTIVGQKMKHIFNFKAFPNSNTTTCRLYFTLKRSWEDRSYGKRQFDIKVNNPLGSGEDPRMRPDPNNADFWGAMGFFTATAEQGKDKATAEEIYKRIQSAPVDDQHSAFCKEFPNHYECFNEENPVFYANMAKEEASYMGQTEAEGQQVYDQIMSKAKNDRKREFCSIYGGHPECMVDKHDGNDQFWVDLVKIEMMENSNGVEHTDAEIKKVQKDVGNALDQMHEFCKRFGYHPECMMATGMECAVEDKSYIDDNANFWSDLGYQEGWARGEDGQVVYDDIQKAGKLSGNTLSDFKAGEKKDFCRRYGDHTECQDQQACRPKQDGLNPNTGKCCTIPVAKCLACKEGVSEADYCMGNPEALNCPRPEYINAEPIYDTVIGPNGEERKIELSTWDNKVTLASGPSGNCCKTQNLSCLACQNGVSDSDYCAFKPETRDCDKVAAAQKSKDTFVQSRKERNGDEGCLISNIDLGFAGVVDILCQTAQKLQQAALVTASIAMTASYM